MASVAPGCTFNCVANSKVATRPKESRVGHLRWRNSGSRRIFPGSFGPFRASKPCFGGDFPVFGPEFGLIYGRSKGARADLQPAEHQLQERALRVEPREPPAGGGGVPGAHALLRVQRTAELHGGVFLTLFDLLLACFQGVSLPKANVEAQHEPFPAQIHVKHHIFLVPGE